MECNRCGLGIGERNPRIGTWCLCCKISDLQSRLFKLKDYQERLNREEEEWDGNINTFS